MWYHEKERWLPDRDEGDNKHWHVTDLVRVKGWIHRMQRRLDDVSHLHSYIILVVLQRMWEELGTWRSLTSHFSFKTEESKIQHVLSFLHPTGSPPAHHPLRGLFQDGRIQDSTCPVFPASYGFTPGPSPLARSVNLSPEKNWLLLLCVSWCSCSVFIAQDKHW